LHQRQQQQEEAAAAAGGGGGSSSRRRKQQQQQEAAAAAGGSSSSRRQQQQQEEAAAAPIYPYCFFSEDIYNELYETKNIFLAYTFSPSGFSNTKSRSTGHPFSPAPSAPSGHFAAQAPGWMLRERFVFPFGFFPLKKKGAPVNFCLKPIH